MAEEKGVRLNRYIAQSGFCSRREADRLIGEGRVLIDGRPGVLGDPVLPGMRVTVNGQSVDQKPQSVYLKLNKPVGVVCTADPREPMNIVSYVRHDERVYPVGRLDKDSEGLILMTNDGDIVNRILRAAGRHEKEYEVTVDKPVTAEFLKKMASGVPILDTVTLPCRIRKTGPRAFTLILVQGLNRQIRRMCEALGYRVTSLKRVRVMNIRLGALKPGQWCELTENEKTTLMALLKDNE